jgi:hypothetical protein
VFFASDSDNLRTLAGKLIRDPEALMLAENAYIMEDGKKKKIQDNFEIRSE